MEDKTTIRDQFAIAALEKSFDWALEIEPRGIHGFTSEIASLAAFMAYSMADAMLEARKPPASVTNASDGQMVISDHPDGRRSPTGP